MRPLGFFPSISIYTYCSIELKFVPSIYTIRPLIFHYVNRGNELNELIILFLRGMGGGGHIGLSHSSIDFIFNHYLNMATLWFLYNFDNREREYPSNAVVFHIM